MKTRYILLAIVASTPILFAAPMLRPWDSTKSLGISLPAAYAQATTALGSATNQLHCVGATISTHFSPEGEWCFTFCTTNQTPKFKFVGVRSDGKVHVQDTLNGGCYLVTIFFKMTTKATPNNSPEPIAVGAGRSAVAVHAASRRWLSCYE
jgi:hypothetical protein